MKLIKKIAAIMFAFMMVFSLSTNVKAVNGNYGDNDGKITISNAVVGQTYTIYRMLKLESFDGDNYSYTIEDGWNDFVESPTGKEYLDKNDDGYITFKSAKDTDADKRLFAKAAYAYAKKATATLNDDAKKSVKAGSTSVTFDKLPLGYYVVGSTVGSLCELKTTNKEVNITDKNEQPLVKKQIIVDGNFDNSESSNLVSENSVNAGDLVSFETTIDIKPGADNYVLHDKIDGNFEITEYHIHNIKDNEKSLTKGQDFNLVFNPDDKCTFHVEFTNKYLTDKAEKIANGAINKITVQYCAKLSNDAPVNTAMKNTTYLTYGTDMRTEDSETETFTFDIPVLKYTGNVTTPLPGAKFKLYTDPKCNNDDTALKFTLNGTKYRYDETSAKTELTSSTDGTIDIEGIKAGTYYLKEVEAPKGYNLLKKPITVTITPVVDTTTNKITGKTITVVKDGKTKTVEKVEVENNKGSLLPSTGGMGTTLIYLIGGALVLGSGFVLMNKKRAKAK